MDQIFSHGTNIDWDTTGITASQNIEKTDWHKCISASKTYPERMSISKEVFGVWKLICLLDFVLISVNTSNMNILQFEHQ